MWLSDNVGVLAVSGSYSLSLLLAKVGTAVPIAIKLKANKSVCCLVAHLLAFLFSIINDVVVDSLI